MNETHQLIPTNNSHNTKRLQSMILRMEVGVSTLTTIVSKHNIRNIIGIHIRNIMSLNLGVLLYLILESSGSLSIGRLTASTVAVVGLIAITVDVHVGEEGVVAVDVHDSCGGVLAVGECW